MSKHKMEAPKEVKTPEGKVVTEAELKETLVNLKNQLVEAQTKVVMLQGAIQVTDLMLNPGSAPANGKTEKIEGA
tara:strand:- start:89 stop:313 length:225 start_codon:yes stop_codon:yes gene_type:complete